MINEALPLRYGLFLMPVHLGDKPLAQCYDEDLELVVRAEELGFHEFWVGEHHTSSIENIVMPEIFIAKALGLTRSIRLGVAPVCLPYHHPFHVASRLAFLDHLSHGRLNVCFGPGAIPTDMEVYGIDAARSATMVAEAIDMVLQIWTRDPPLELSGQFWNIRLRDRIDGEMGVGVAHKPLQRPHPPIASPAIRRDSPGLPAAAARGFRPFSHHMVSTETLANHWQTFSAGAMEAGRVPQVADWIVGRNVFVAETTDEARRGARGNSLGACLQYILELSRRGPGLGMWRRNGQMSDAECHLDYMLDEVVIAGDPAEVARRIIALREHLGPFGTLVLVAHDWDDQESWLRSLELFAHEVMPAVERHSKTDRGDKIRGFG